jgi:hypothetical protein
MKAKVQMVMLCAKKLQVTEWIVVACAIFYNSGKGFVSTLNRDDVEEMYQRYLKDGFVSQRLEDFCLDYLSDRIPPNLLINALNKQNDNARTQQMNVRKKK